MTILPRRPFAMLKPLPNGREYLPRCSRTFGSSRGATRVCASTLIWMWFARRGAKLWQRQTGIMARGRLPRLSPMNILPRAGGRSITICTATSCFVVHVHRWRPFPVLIPTTPRISGQRWTNGGQAESMRSPSPTTQMAQGGGCLSSPTSMATQSTQPTCLSAAVTNPWWK